jgi:DNA protecting protein DprA
MVEELCMASKSGESRTLDLFGNDAGIAPSETTGFPDGAEMTAATNLEPGAATPRFDVHLLALAHVHGVGMHALRALIRGYGNLARVWRDDPARIAEILSHARVPGSAQIATAIAIDGRQLIAKGERERDRLGRRGYVLIGSHDPAFPQRLRDMSDPPLWLFIEGNPAALSAPPLVAIVGTRKASKQGIETTRHLARLVLEEGLGIVSGLAEGIDRQAHDVAARHNARQVAILGTGIEARFPASNNELRQSIVETGGVVITEYLPDERYGKANFVQRNRLQAALASAVCPVEATFQSGTAHTVRFARDFGRLLFGVHRGPVAPDNEIFHELVTDGMPTFDLATDPGRKALRVFLERIEGQRASPLEPIGIEFLVKSIVDRVRQIPSYHDLTDADRQRIIEQVAKALEPELAPVDPHDDAP